MIDIDNAVKLFVKYSKKFNLKDQNIMRKFHHTFRVMEYAKDIARSEGLLVDDIALACVCALLHDIGRYQEWTKYHTYEDSLAFDHGDLGYQILLKNNYIAKFTKNKKYQQIILDAVKNHNKYSIDSIVSDKNLLMSKIVRDADKLDIIKEQCNTLNTIEDNINPDILNQLNKEQLVNGVYCQNEHDDVLRELGFIYDINFNYSYNFLTTNKIVESKITLLKQHTKNIEVLDKLQDKLVTYISKKTVKAL